MHGPGSTVPSTEPFTVRRFDRGVGIRKAAAVCILAAGLSACGVVSVLVDGFKYAKAVEADLQEATGMRPSVGFNWHNGRLASVTINFPRIYDEKPLRELARTARAAVIKEFEETPQDIVLAFSLGATSGTTTQRQTN